ncbi:MAG: hypothetical protein AMXMBFR33_63370 [Candidatus Xenobia bacterium]
MPPERESRLETLQGIPERLVAALKSEIRAVTSEQVNDLWMVVQALREGGGGGGGGGAAPEELLELKKEIKTLKKQVATIEADLEDVPEEEDPLVQVKKLEERLAEVEARPAGSGESGPSATDPNVLVRLAELEERVDRNPAFELEDRLAQLEPRLIQLESRGSNGAAAAPSAEVLERIGELESRLKNLDLLEKLESRVKELEVERFDGLEAKLKKIERERLDELDSKLAAMASLLAQIKASEPAAAAPAAPTSVDGADKVAPPPDLDFSLDDLLYVVLKHEASELLLKTGSPSVARLHGQWVPIGDHILRPEDCRSLILNAMPAEHRKLLLDRKDVTVACSALGVRFRLDAYLQRGSVCGVFKPLAARVPALADLGLPVLLEQLAGHRDGLILVAGPPQSGKTTTLASLVDAINATRRIQIFTIEDPIEYYHQDKKSVVSQREVGTDANSFTEALNHALRQQADVVALSELRDAETMYASLVAAESGHLVLSSLASPTTVGAIEWILNSFEGAARETVQILLASTLRAVISLRMLPRADGKGNVVATEILVVNDLVRNYLAEGMVNLLGPLLEAGSSEHLHPFRESIARLQDVGLVAREGAPRVAAVEPAVEAAEPQVSQLKLEEARVDDTMMGWL